MTFEHTSARPHAWQAGYRNPATAVKIRKCPLLAPGPQLGMGPWRIHNLNLGLWAPAQDVLGSNNPAPSDFTEVKKLIRQRPIPRARPLGPISPGCFPRGPQNSSPKTTGQKEDFPENTPTSPSGTVDERCSSNARVGFGGTSAERAVLPQTALATESGAGGGVGGWRSRHHTGLLWF